MRCIAGFVALSFSALSFSVAPGLPTDVNTSDFDFVGQVNGASGVLVGANTVLTARHVGAGTFTLPGIGTFNVLAGSVKNHPTDDLTLFQIDTGSTTLTNYAQINVNRVAANTAITMVGFGASGVLNGSGTGYDITISAGTRRKATGIVEGTRMVEEPGFRLASIYSPLRSNGQGALVGGDSGGGWFLQDGSSRPQLVGINSWIDNFGTFSSWFQFSNHPTNFFGSGAADLSEYNGWLVQNGASVVPEPGTITVLAIGSLLALCRRRKG
ncbi:MAG: trypsin-like serine protease [Armatimonadota bacterium]